MISNIEIILAAIGVVLVYLIYYVFTKDSQQSRQIRAMAHAVEDLNRQLFEMHKKLHKEIVEVAATIPSKEEQHMQHNFDQDVQDLNLALSESLQSIEHSMQEQKHEFSDRIQTLEANLKSLTLPSSVHSMDDDKIIALYQQGYTLEMIAKELHLSKAEVEFVLKINRIR